jgi:D-alanine-D-alanine ligase-like ATP-grasp enzyme
MTGTPRIDFLINPTTQEFVIIEPNSIPGNLSMHIWWASWVTPVQLIRSLISQAELKEYHYEQASLFNTSILDQYAQLASGGSKKMWVK